MTRNRPPDTDGDDFLRTRALDLRARGWSNPDIRAELGLSSWKLTRLLHGHVEPCHPNLAHRARPDLRAQARDLRVQGWSYDAIARELRVSKSSLSLWLRDLPKPERPHPGPVPKERNMTQEEWEDHCANRWAAHQRRGAEERRAEVVAAARQVGELTDRELLIAGAMVYWAEGAKTKPWNRRASVVLINSDPDLIRLFLRFLELLGWGTDRLTFRVSIHESAGVERAVRFWAKTVGVPPDRFRKTSLKKHNPKTVRRRKGASYRGCLVVYARKSAGLYRCVQGLAMGAMIGAAETARRVSAAAEEQEVGGWDGAAQGPS